MPQHVSKAIEAACEGAGVSLIELGVRGQHRQLRLEISIDSPDGITHEHCRAVSRSIDDQLQEDEFYTRLKSVDVSSPGAETPVRFLWQLTKHVGRTVRIVCIDGSTIQGTLISADDTGVEVQPKNKERKKAPEPVQTIMASQIKEARTVIEL